MCLSFSSLSRPISASLYFLCLCVPLCLYLCLYLCCLSDCLSASLPVYLPVGLPVNLPVSLLTCLTQAFCLLALLYVYLSVFSSICDSASLLACLAVLLSACLSVCQIFTSSVLNLVFKQPSLVVAAHGTNRPDEPGVTDAYLSASGSVRSVQQQFPYHLRLVWEFVHLLHPPNIPRFRAHRTVRPTVAQFPSLSTHYFSRMLTRVYPHGTLLKAKAGHRKFLAGV